MPYSQWLIPDRKAVGALNYDLRKFMARIDHLPERNKAPVIEAINNLKDVLASVIDFDDDGTEIADHAI